MDSGYADVPWNIMPDSDWESLREFNFPPEVRAHLARKLYEGRETIMDERKRPNRRFIRRQLGSIRRARIGSPMPTPPLPYVAQLLAGMARRDPRFGKGDLARGRDALEFIATSRVITPDIRDWAMLCGRYQPGNASRDRPRGGCGIFAERVFIGSLVAFWEERLGREVTNWVGELVTGRRIGASPCTKFVHRCLELVGVKISLEATSDRIDRALADMKTAEAAGLGRNVMALLLNPARASNAPM